MKEDSTHFNVLDGRKNIARKPRKEWIVRSGKGQGEIGEYITENGIIVSKSISRSSLNCTKEQLWYIHVAIYWSLQQAISGKSSVNSIPDTSMLDYLSIWLYSWGGVTNSRGEFA